MKEKFVIKIETLHASGAGDSENVSKAAELNCINLVSFPFFLSSFPKKMNQNTFGSRCVTARPSSSFLRFVRIKTKTWTKLKPLPIIV